MKPEVAAAQREYLQMLDAELTRREQQQAAMQQQWQQHQEDQQGDQQGMATPNRQQQEEGYSEEGAEGAYSPLTPSTVGQSPAAADHDIDAVGGEADAAQANDVEAAPDMYGTDNAGYMPEVRPHWCLPAQL